MQEQTAEEQITTHIDKYTSRNKRFQTSPGKAGQGSHNYTFLTYLGDSTQLGHLPPEDPPSPDNLQRGAGYEKASPVRKATVPYVADSVSLARWVTRSSVGSPILTVRRKASL
jgi:hypothetical protein